MFTSCSSVSLSARPNNTEGDTLSPPESEPDARPVVQISFPLVFCRLNVYARRVSLLAHFLTLKVHNYSGRTTGDGVSIGPLTHVEVLTFLSYGILICPVLLILDTVHVDLKVQWSNAPWTDYKASLTSLHIKNR